METCNSRAGVTGGSEAHDKGAGNSGSLLEDISLTLNHLSSPNLTYTLKLSNGSLSLSKATSHVT